MRMGHLLSPELTPWWVTTHKELVPSLGDTGKSLGPRWRLSLSPAGGGGAVQVWPPAWALTLAQASLASGSICKGLKQIPGVKTP